MVICEFVASHWSKIHFIFHLKISIEKKDSVFVCWFSVIKITFERDFSLNKPRFVVGLYFACFYIKVLLFGLFVADVLDLSI